MPRPYLLGKKGIGVPNSFDSFHVESTSLKVRLTYPVTAIFTSCDAVEGSLRLKPVFISWANCLATSDKGFPSCTLDKAFWADSVIIGPSSEITWRVVTRYAFTSHRWLIAYETHVTEYFESCDLEELLYLSEQDPHQCFSMIQLFHRTIIFLISVLFRYYVGISKDLFECVWVHNIWYLVPVHYNELPLKDLFSVLLQFGSEPSWNTLKWWSRNESLLP